MPFNILFQCFFYKVDILIYLYNFLRPSSDRDVTSFTQLLEDLIEICETGGEAVIYVSQGQGFAWRLLGVMVE
jgi:hypothetical protein